MIDRLKEFPAEFSLPTEPAARPPVPDLCDKCGSQDIEQMHTCTLSIGPLDFKECQECGHQWDHT